MIGSCLWQILIFIFALSLIGVSFSLSKLYVTDSLKRPSSLSNFNFLFFFWVEIFRSLILNYTPNIFLIFGVVNFHFFIFSLISMFPLWIRIHFKWLFLYVSLYITKIKNKINQWKCIKKLLNIKENTPNSNLKWKIFF